MTVPVWSLLGFAAWTVLLLAFTVGIYRWSRILTARAQLAEFPADARGGEDWYQRATRAHANAAHCLFVVYSSVYAISVAGVAGPLVDALSASVLAARVVQSSVHVSFKQTNTVVGVRFTFFSVQLVAFLVLIGIVARAGLPA